MTMYTSIQYLKGVGSKRAKLFEKLGIRTVGALLYFFPRHYLDLLNTVDITAAPFDESVSIKATVLQKPKRIDIRRGLTLFKTRVSDRHAMMNITIFNNQYAANRLEEGETFLFYGKVGGTFTMREMNSPMIEPVDTTARIKPIYPQTAGLNSNFIQNCVTQAIKAVSGDLEDPIPADIRKHYHLAHIQFALKNIHFPESTEAIEVARRRLIFEELLTLQLGLFLLKSQNKQTTGCVMPKNNIDTFYKTLPFTPTKAQQRAVQEALSDMATTVPMNRLLQGDVGSGKTLVAAALIDTAVQSGYQASMLAPTEILAAQHFETLQSFLSPRHITCALLTGSSTAKEKREIKENIKNGQIQVVVGTHALIQKDVVFQNLGLAITDEQHRFGVKQRSALIQKGNSPHTLVMSATPIPRTLALMLYGDLDISILDELPPGRQPIETYCVNSSYSERVYRYIANHLNKGQQGYIVTPLIDGEESDLNLKGVIEYTQELSKGPFRQYKVAMLHGQMKPQEKESIMQAFANGDIQLLVSTTVIEVGVDVPNATIMLIQNAERFGLSQLHQLRGRIGRGKYKSTCILMTDADNELTIQRMKIMTDTTDGFKIADEDLKLRGPGDFFGQRQHGLPDLRIADMLRDIDTLKQAQKTAKHILQEDHNLSLEKHKKLFMAVQDLFKRTGSEALN